MIHKKTILYKLEITKAHKVGILVTPQIQALVPYIFVCPLIKMVLSTYCGNTKYHKG